MDTPINKPVIAVAAAVIAVGLGTWYYFHSRSTAAPAPAATALTQPAVPAHDEEPPIEHPVPTAADAPTAAPLPELNDSDAALVAALTSVAGSEIVTDFILTPNVVRRIVVTVDNLSRSKIPVEKRPIVGPQGAFMAVGDELHATIDEGNWQRYQPYLNALEHLDMTRLADVYLHYYPLFQRAYEDLGYPKSYFNDRLVQIIDLLLKTPDVPAPVDLVRPNVMYQFADAQLEGLPAGQKVLLRMGPDAAAAVKIKLKALRAAVAAAPPPH